MNIYVFDSWKKHFGEGIDHWREQGHEVRTGMYWGIGLTEWADVQIFHPCDNNAIKASQTAKPKDTITIVEAVDVDIYANHPGAVRWEYVDALVFMAEHMREYAEARFKFPASLPRYVVHGGVNLDRWTLRTGPRGYNVAWIGRLWIAKNVFGALQVFNQLIRADPYSPWRLFLRGEKWHPPTWWSRHCESYLATNPTLAERVEFVDHVDDVNAWLDGMDYLLQTSYKEALSYVVCQAAAKGIRPIVQNTTGALDIWPRRWVFDTHDEAVVALLTDYDREEVRSVIKERYPLNKRMDRFLDIVSEV